MTALLLFLAITAAVYPLAVLRARLRPEPLDLPVWCWRILLACRVRRPRTVRRHEGPRTGHRTVAPGLTEKDHAGRW